MMLINLIYVAISISYSNDLFLIFIFSVGKSGWIIFIFMFITTSVFYVRINKRRDRESIYISLFNIQKFNTERYLEYRFRFRVALRRENDMYRERVNKRDIEREHMNYINIYIYETSMRLLYFYMQKLNRHQLNLPFFSCNIKHRKTKHLWKSIK